MVGRIVVGFIAGAISVLLVHQPLLMLFKSIGWIAQFTPYNTAPFAGAPAMIKTVFAPMGGFPIIANLVFWGGVWGALFALIYRVFPGPMIVKGLLFGLVLVILSNWLVLPYLRGQPFFANFDVMRLLVGGLLQMAFGAGIAIIYSLMRREEMAMA
jgi:hypothetical protein